MLGMQGAWPLVAMHQAETDTGQGMADSILHESGLPALCTAITSIHVCSIQAILLALDRKDREREMVSVLLAELHPKVLVEEQISEGFTAIMLSCEASPAQQRKAHL